MVAHRYFIFHYYLQKQPFLVQRRVWVAGWLWRQYNQQQTKQPFLGLLIEEKWLILSLRAVLGSLKHAS
jgi:hypothetical protein